MAYIFRFTDPANDATVRLDITNYVNESLTEIDFGDPDLTVFPARRIVRLPLIVEGADKDAAHAAWQAVIKEVERASALEVRLDGATSSVWFDALVDVAQQLIAPPSDRSRIRNRFKFGHDRSVLVLGELELVCKPYVRSAEVTAVSAVAIENGPNGSNFVDVAVNPIGDVEAPAQVEIAYDTTPTRLIERVFRRTKGTPGNYKSLYEAEDATLSGGTVSAVEAAASNGNRTTTTPANQNLTQTHEWAEATNPADKVGQVQCFIKLRDADTIAGRLKARLDLVFASGEISKGETILITADAGHLGAGGFYELWYLGSHRIPEDPAPASWKWRLYLQRTTGLAVIHLDYLGVFPTDEAVSILDFTAESDVTGSAVKSFSLDTEKNKAWWGTLSSFQAPASLSNRGLFLKPGMLNRLIVSCEADTHTSGGVSAKDAPPSIGLNVATITVKFKPRWRHAK